MRPTSETLAETIELMIERKGDHWGDGAALDLEARILVSCLYRLRIYIAHAHSSSRQRHRLYILARRLSLLELLRFLWP